MGKIRKRLLGDLRLCLQDAFKSGVILDARCVIRSEYLGGKTKIAFRHLLEYLFHFGKGSIYRSGNLPLDLLHVVVHAFELDQAVDIACGQGTDIPEVLAHADQVFFRDCLCPVAEYLKDFFKLSLGKHQASPPSGETGSSSVLSTVSGSSICAATECSFWMRSISSSFCSSVQSGCSMSTLV